MLFKPLVLDFLSENIWTFIAYILIILAFFPIKSVILPNIYGMMFDQIKTISKFTDIYNFRENFSKMNFPGALVALIALWIVVILSSSVKSYIESLLIPGYFTYLRQLLFAKTVNCTIIQYFGNAEILKLTIDRETFFNTTVSENLRDSLDNLMNVFLNNTVDHEIEKNASLENKSREKLQRIMSLQGMILFMTDFIIVATFALCLLFLYYLISKKDVKVTQGIVMVMILGQFLNYFIYVNNGFIYNIAYRVGIISSSKDYLENIFGSKGGRTLSSGISTGNIQFKNVKFRYDKTHDNYIYDDLNIQFHAGKRYAIVGQSGAGKTTMMKLLVGLYTPESGAIYIDSVDTRHMKLDYLRKNVNYINQRTTLFNETIMYNMLYGNPEISEKTVIAKLKKYDLLKIFDEIPEGVYANAGVNGGNLSGGMQRIVILMRGILKPGVIVIMDEPTTGLDTNTIRNVKKMIFEETVGKTLIVVTHELEMRSGMEEKEV